MEKRINLNGVVIQRALHCENYEAIKSATASKIKELAFLTVDYCGGIYHGYFVACSPWYDLALFVIDPQTENIIYSDLAIHYTYKQTTTGKLEAMDKKAASLLFDPVGIAAEMPSNYSDFRARREFAQNIYSNRYKSVSAWYIGKPTTEQAGAAQNGFMSYKTFRYYTTKEHAAEVDNIIAAVEIRHRERLNDFDYAKQAIKSEFYNYECMYGERYAEACAAAGIDSDKMTDTQRRAYTAAYNEFWEEVNSRDY